MQHGKFIFPKKKLSITSVKRLQLAGKGNSFTTYRGWISVYYIHPIRWGYQRLQKLGVKEQLIVIWRWQRYIIVIRSVRKMVHPGNCFDHHYYTLCNGVIVFLSLDVEIVTRDAECDSTHDVPKRAFITELHDRLDDWSSCLPMYKMITFTDGFTSPKVQKLVHVLCALETEVSIWRSLVKLASDFQTETFAALLRISEKQPIDTQQQEIYICSDSQRSMR